MPYLRDDACGRLSVLASGVQIPGIGWDCPLPEGRVALTTYSIHFTSTLVNARKGRKNLRTLLLPSTLALQRASLHRLDLNPLILNRSVCVFGALNTAL